MSPKWKPGSSVEGHDCIRDKILNGSPGLDIDTQMSDIPLPLFVPEA